MAQGRAQTNDMSPFPPVFLINSDLPSFDEKAYSTLEICRAAETLTGPNTIDGAQPKNLLWRIYPLTQQARCDMLASGFSLRGIHVRPYDKNPLIVQYSDGEREREAPTTRVIVGGVPFSFNNEAILDTISRLPDVNVRSAIFYERARDENKKLTSYKTGRRYLFIDVPPTPLPKKLKIGMFTATIFHWEQKQTQTCGNCLETGHSAPACVQPMKCRQCFGLGHRAGAPECRMIPPETRTPQDHQEQQETAHESSHEDPPSNHCTTPSRPTRPTPPPRQPPRQTSRSPTPHQRPRKPSTSPNPRQQSPTASSASSAKPASTQGHKSQERGRSHLRQARLTLEAVIQRNKTPTVTATPKSMTKVLDGDLLGDQFERDLSPRTKRRREEEKKDTTSATSAMENENENGLC